MPVGGQRPRVEVPVFFVDYLNVYIRPFFGWDLENSKQKT